MPSSLSHPLFTVAYGVTASVPRSSEEDAASAVTTIIEYALDCAAAAAADVWPRNAWKYADWVGRARVAARTGEVKGRLAVEEVEPLWNLVGLHVGYAGDPADPAKIRVPENQKRAAYFVYRMVMNAYLLAHIKARKTGKVTSDGRTVAEIVSGLLLSMSADGEGYVDAKKVHTLCTEAASAFVANPAFTRTAA